MQTGWRGRHWPPRPSVEDEIDALAHEFASTKLSVTTDDDAQSRGSVDQLPIILDAFLNHQPSREKTRESPRNKDHGSVKSNSSVESFGPSTPPDTNCDRRYVYIPHEGAEIPITYSDNDLKARAAKAESSRPSKKRDESRGRQTVPKIDAELGADLQNMGIKRRAPSPYAFIKPEKTRASGEFSLSPEIATPGARLPNIDSRRPASARPPVQRKKEDLSDSSDSGRRPRLPERRRSTRHSFTRERPSLSILDDRPKIGVDQRSASYSFPKKDPAAPPRKSLLSDERSSHHDSRSSKPDSPHQSSDESSKSRLKVSDPRGGTRSARPSFSKPERPWLDTSDPRHSYDANSPTQSREHHRKHRKHTDPGRHPSVYDSRGYLEPSSGRTPKAMEDYFEKAFQDNQIKRIASPRASPAASPLTSPHRTPPRSPTADGGFVPLSRSRQAGSRDLKPFTPVTPMASSARVSSDMLSIGRTDTFPASGRRSMNSSPLTSPSEDRKMDHRFSVQAPSPMMRPAADRRSTHSISSGDERDPRRSATLPITPAAFELKQPSPHRPVHSTPVSTNVIPRVPSRDPHTPSNPLQLSPCPRPKPVAGCYDWYTIKGFPHLDLCPSCMGQIGGSRFRDFFIPSLPKSRSEEVLCALSRPWMRVAWIQTLKQRRDNLNLLYRIHDLSEAAKPCTGKDGAVRNWYRILDPASGSPVPNFDACSTCVRSAEILWPELRGVFRRRGDTVQERTCALRCDSKRFSSYLNHLDNTATKAFNEDRDPDMRAFADHARRTTAIRECSKDDLILGQAWHIIPSLPEFTICEDCYEEFVYPIRSEPIASRIIPRPQPVGPAENAHSCQLYSNRMRKIFREAVKYDDYEFLKAEAVRRHRVERLLQERHTLLMREYPDQKRAEQLGKIVEEWKKWE